MNLTFVIILIVVTIGLFWYLSDKEWK